METSNLVAIVLGAVAIVIIGVLLVSASTPARARARARVYLTKLFFRYKYDYRKEWLRFIGTLSESGLDDVPAVAVRAVAQIVSSPGGVIWAQGKKGGPYEPLGSWQCEIPTIAPVCADSALVHFLLDRQWVIDLEERQRYPTRYDGLALHEFLEGGSQWWLIVPLFHGKRLLGFMSLRKPNIVRTLNFEDHDLLRTVGRHVSMHINQSETDKRLAESRQFGAYNRLTAFLMHDLNNLIAQQSLVVKNAERFRDNPQFVDDAIETIANSVTRMKRLMEQLRRGSRTTVRRNIDLHSVLVRATERSGSLLPRPVLLEGANSIYVLADEDRLTNVFEHLIRNAQDATGDDGQIDIRVTESNGSAVVSISDNGGGMSPEFIRTRLFRPFDSTKGSHAMGIGAYQAREYARMLGGQLDVHSKEGQGTTFALMLPTSN